jgi:hypothetical protein
VILAALLFQVAAPVDPCAWGPLMPPRRMTGVFVNEFEAQRFYEDSDVAVISRVTAFAWFSRDKARQHASVGLWPLDHVFRVEFIGVERAAPTGTFNRHGPCPPTSGETSKVDVIEIVAQEDLGPASEVLPKRRR